MLRAERGVHRYSTSSSEPLVALDGYRPYLTVGDTNRLVTPYIVSDRSVAATKKTFLPWATSATRLARSPHWVTSSFIAMYSCGPTPSPDWRSWSMHGWPSLGEKIV